MSFLRGCDGCQVDLTVEDREVLACGLLPPVAGMRPWTPPDLSAIAHEEDGTPQPPLTVCPGYTVRLPQVVEARRARVHAELGTLADLYSEGRKPILLQALEWAKLAADEESEAWRNRQREDRHGHPR